MGKNNNIKDIIIDKKKEIIFIKDNSTIYNNHMKEIIFEFIFSEKNNRLEKIFYHIDNQEFSSEFFFMDLNSEIVNKNLSELETELLYTYLLDIFNSIKNIIKLDLVKEDEFNNLFVIKLNLFFYDILFFLSEKLNKKLNGYTDFYKGILSDNVIISQTDKKGIITYVNHGFCELTGYTSEELIGKTHSIIRNKDTESDIYKNLWDTIQLGKTWSGVLKNNKKDGSSYYVKVYIRPLIINNEDLGYISIKTDITKIIEFQQKNKKLMSDIQKQNIALINTIGESIWILDNQNKTVYANNNFCQLVGYNLSEIIGKNANDFLNTELINEKIVNIGDVSKNEWTIKTKKLEIIPILFALTPIPGGGKIGVITDLRDIKNIENENNEIKRKAKINAIAYGISLVFILSFALAFVIKFGGNCTI